MSELKLGIDLDGTISDAPEFFRKLSSIWPGEVHVITFRRDRDKAIADLASFGIRYHEVHLVSTFAEKAVVIKRLEIGVYFDDQPEMIQDICPLTTVFLQRNEGNFDFEDRRFMLSERTGKLV